MRTPMGSGLLELVGLRISQLNGCGACVYGHIQAAKRAGETEERLIMITVWRDAPFFSDAERAALDLAESITRIASAGPGRCRTMSWPRPPTTTTCGSWSRCCC